MTPDEISQQSPGELHAMRAAFLKRRAADLEAVSNAVALAIARCFSGGGE